jgi:antitoxin MazE
MSAPVKARIVKIGNSQGIRIPKILLEQVGFGTEVEVEARGHELVVRSSHQVRSGWEDAFQLMAERGDDQLLDPDTTGLTEWDKEEWAW